MKNCFFCGPAAAVWAKNYHCQPTGTDMYPIGVPLWSNHLPDRSDMSAKVRGFSAGDIARNSHGHVAIVTYSSYTSCAIKVCLATKYSNEYDSNAMSWRIIKKASPEQARLWLGATAGFNLAKTAEAVVNNFNAFPKNQY